MIWFAGTVVVAIGIAAILLMSLLATMWRAWWLYPAWSWYFVPLGLPNITFWHFTALLFFFMSLKSIDTKKDDREENWGSIAVAFLWPIAAWGLLRWMR